MKRMTADRNFHCLRKPFRFSYFARRSISERNINPNSLKSNFSVLVEAGMKPTKSGNRTSNWARTFTRKIFKAVCCPLWRVYGTENRYDFLHTILRKKWPIASCGEHINRVNRLAGRKVIKMGQTYFLFYYLKIQKCKDNIWYQTFECALCGSKVNKKRKAYS